MVVDLRTGVDPAEFFGSGFLSYERILGTPDQFVASVDVATSFETLDLARSLSLDSRLDWASPEFYFQPRLTSLPTDDLFQHQWTLHNTGQFGGTAGADAHLEEAWAIETGVSAPVTIAILDTGIDLTHPDLNIFTNPGEVPGNNIDDDGNGWIDDVHGWDFHNNDNDAGPQVPGDNHGTAVAGTAAAIGGNTIGVVGASQHAAVMPVAIARNDIGDGTGFTKNAQIAEAIYYAAGRTADGLGTWAAADILNNSWGGGSSTVVSTALSWAEQSGRSGLGAVILAATGNSGASSISFPASHASTIAVGATSNTDVRASYSQYGSGIDVVAPAGGGFQSGESTARTVSTDRQGSDGYTSDDYTGFGSAGLAGTSFSTPLTAGVAALMLSRNPTLSPAQVRSILRDTADKIGGVTYDAGGFHSEYGFGRINAGAALAQVSAVSEIDVRGNDISISSGDNSPSTTDHTDFGTTFISGGAILRHFQVLSSGSADLNLTGSPIVQISGATEFTVDLQPDGLIAKQGGTSTFTIRFAPTSVGIRTATVTILNDDADESSYSFTITAVGTATAEPEVELRGNGLLIENGDSSPSTTDNTYFGSVDVIAGTSTRTYRIENHGAAPLNVTPLSSGSFTGLHAGDFTVIGQPSATVAPGGGSTEFIVQFSPSGDGLRQATVNLVTNDADESSFTFDVSGVGERYDFGDAPAPWLTTLAENGGRHLVTGTGPTLGAGVDAESDGSHSADALGDDNSGGPDDEGGVTFGGIRVGQGRAAVTVNVQNVSTTARLDAWIDFNGDGSWLGIDEQIAAAKSVSVGDNQIVFDVPAWAIAGGTYARFRVSTAGGLSPYGAAPDGEVEDHFVVIQSPAPATGDFKSVHNVTTTADGASHVTAIDLDRDGDIDIVSGNAYEDSLVWYENDGSELFTAHVISATVDDIAALSVVDLDSDGDLDIVAGQNRTGFYDSLYWFRNNGSQSFTRQTIYQASGATGTALGIRTVFPLDYDSDGDMDVVSVGGENIGGDSFGEILVSLNNGSETFETRMVSDAVPNGTSIYPADIDRDGDIDFATTSFGDGHIRWFENVGINGFLPRTVDAFASGAQSVFVADVDGDNDMDMVAAASGGDMIAWYENNGSQVFSRHIIDATADFAIEVFVADIDGDADLDILSVSVFDDTIAWYENDGNQAFTQRTLSDTADQARSVSVSDVDGDGDLDVIAAARGDDTIVWFENTGYDFGDTPSPYETRLAEDGARHGDTGPKLGTNRDSEPDGVHSANADADDTTGTTDDEDGVTLPATIVVSTLTTTTGTIDVDLQNPDGTSNLLDAWIDFNRDGDWNDPGEQIFTGENLGTTAEVKSLTFVIPRDTGANVVAGVSYARFRLSTSGGLSPTGSATDGEVEDYVVTISSVTPTVTFTTAGQSGSENVGTMTVTVTLSDAVGTDVTIPFTLGGTAENGTAKDYTVTASPVVITAGDTSAAITVTVNDDAETEGDETIIVAMGTPTSANAGAITVHTVTVEDNDLVPELSIAADAAVKLEGDSGNTSFTFKVTRSGDLSGATTVNYAVTGTGGSPADAADFGGTLPSGVVSFDPTDDTETITISVSGDVEIEPDETFTVTLSGASSPAVIAGDTAVGTIQNDDAANSLISGIKYHDLDGDGLKDAGEPALSGWTVFLDTDDDGELDAGEVSVVTAADGTYTFSGLAAGTYNVAEVRQSGWTSTFSTITSAA
ncbi:MAG: S8 family serine peptidase, partial [Planctomycetaceae bacterium]|nr:S8 family serine peptidase [Planctomycetaceae bacterium]